MGAMLFLGVYNKRETRDSLVEMLRKSIKWM